MFILATLAVVGGDSLTNFAVALLLGLLIGIYSTIFTAAPLAVWAEERWPIGLPTQLARGQSTRTPMCLSREGRAGQPNGAALLTGLWTSESDPAQPAAAAAAAPGMSMRATGGLEQAGLLHCLRGCEVRRSRPSR